MKGFKSQLSVTISRMQMIKIFQKYYNDKRDDELKDLDWHNKCLSVINQEDQSNLHCCPPTVSDNIKFNNVIAYEVNDNKYLRFEDIMSCKGENISVSSFCALLDDTFVENPTTYAAEFFYDITESRDEYGHFIVHCHGLNPAELCALLKFLDEE